MKKLLKNKTLIYSVMVLLVLLVATVSVTYAFFTTRMDGTSSNVTVTSAKIGKVTFEADGIDGDGILPGWTSGIKNIKVTSTDTDYNIPFECTLSISNNEFSNLYLTVDGTNGIKMEAEQITSNHITLMKGTINSNNLEFEATYSLAFKETGENQNTEQDKELSAKVVCSLGDTNRLYYSDGSVGLRADGIDADGEEIEVTVSTPTNSSTLKTEMEENYQLLGLTSEQASSSKIIGLSAEGEYPITMHVAVSDIASPGETVVVLHYDSTYNEWENLGNYTVNSNYEIEVSFDSLSPIALVNKGTDTTDTAKRLPSSYTRVEYIESTGTQYIDTGYLHNTKTTKYEMQVEFTAFPSVYSTFFGARSDSSGPEAYYMGLGNTGYTYSCIGGTKKNSLGLNISLNTKYTIESNPSNGFTINNTLYSDAYSYNVNSVYPLYIFALNQRNSVIETAMMKLYYFKIYNGDTLIREFIPVYRKSDNVVGLYDRYNQVFYTNQGTGEFRLPTSAFNEIYKTVDYIESTGTEYINTYVTPTDTTKMQLKFMNLQSTGANIIGYAKQTDTESDSFRFFNYNNSAYLDYGCGSGCNRLIGSSITPNNIYELEIGNRYVKNLQTNTNIISGTAVTFTEKNYYIYINGNHSFSKNRWYYLKIYKGSTLVRDYIPVYRISDKVAGLFDKVTNVFYTNSGTGNFTYTDN